jgi:uncharacterized protein (DUF1800 family)
MSQALCLLALVGLAACGGGKSSGPNASNPPVTDQPAWATHRVAASARPETDEEASRFLAQASFGASRRDIAQLRELGYTQWIDAQLKMRPSVLHASLAQARTGEGVPHQFNHTFWQHALSGPDQLRLRMAFALSQIFVVSFASTCGAPTTAATPSYFDLLLEHGTSRYETLLAQVAMHPVMGCYLSHQRSQKGNPETGQVPDENFARELLQLFSIGLVQLKMDGTPTNPSHPMETYSPADVSELARVFTGYSWTCRDSTWSEEACFRYWGGAPRAGFADPWTEPMRNYSFMHDTGGKTFLGNTLPAGLDASVELERTLSLIASHPNVAPFISRQLIQRFVTSNPSSAYVERVAMAFIASRGHLGETVKAILLDLEAREAPAASDRHAGKVKEPILRLSAILRGMDAQSDSGRYLIGATTEASYGLNQSPLNAPSVFNFYRPGYVPPNSATAAANLVAPELQVVHESSLAGYANFMRDVIWAGAGEAGYQQKASRRDVQMAFNRSEDDPWLMLADRPEELVSQMATLLTWGQMSDATRSDIATSIATINFSGTPTTSQQRLDTRRQRVWSALLLLSVSPEFLIQR